MVEFWKIFWGAVGTILTGLASWGSIMLTTWLNSKIKDKKLKEMATKLLDIVTRAVMTVTQTFVSTMKSAGKFTEEAHQEAMKKCKEIVDSQLTQELRDYLKDNYKDPDSYLTSLIESTILGLKR